MKYYFVVAQSTDSDRSYILSDSMSHASKFMNDYLVTGGFDEHPDRAAVPCKFDVHIVKSGDIIDHRYRVTIYDSGRVMVEHNAYGVTSQYIGHINIPIHECDTEHPVTTKNGWMRGTHYWI